MTNRRIEKIKNIFETYDSIVKTSILRMNKVCSRDIAELVNTGHVVKIKTGYYAWNSGFKYLDDLEIVQGIIPNGVISVFSAAVIHELTTINPMNITVTIPAKMMRPKLPGYPPVELFYTSDKNLELGMVNYQMEHKSVRMYNLERTVCDFFKYTGKVGNDVALEVLKNYMSRRNKNIQQIFEYATRLRVKKYIKPYVEALI